MDLETRLDTYFGKTPRIHPSAYIAGNATVLGDVEVGENASVWFGAVARGDINRIVIGAGSNVQDGCVLHVADDYPCIIGSLVTCGHAAILHACTVEDEVLIGMRSTILDGAVIGARSIIGAGTLVTGKTIIPPGSLVFGNPGEIVRTLSESDQAKVRDWAVKYIVTSRRYLAREDGMAPF